MAAAKVVTAVKATPSSKKFSSTGIKDTNNFADKPKPIDFDKFLPWVCLEMQVENVVIVQRTNQVKLQNVTKRSSTAKLKQDKVESIKRVESVNDCPDYSIIVTALYDSHERLSELTIKGCGTDIPTKVIQAITLCLPFHPFLTKVIFLSGIHMSLLRKIGKMLTHSKISNICLDNSNVPEGNYCNLLEHASKLKILSLSRCNINDRMCFEIFSRLSFGCPSEKTVMILDLSSNLITDDGAKVIGAVLRMNRHLVHLNLSGNSITDVGLYFIMEHLSEFPLTYDEAVERRLRYFKYCKDKTEVYKKCLDEIRKMPTTAVEVKMHKSTTVPRRYSLDKQLRKKGKKSLNIDNDPEKKTKEIIGEFEDPFDSNNIIIKDGYSYCVGNFKLCSLNLAYNNLELLSLLKILDVLKYQFTCDKKSSGKGLIRIVLDGNNFPQWCPELESIEDYLSKTILEHSAISLPSWYRRRTSSNCSKLTFKM